MSKYVNYTINQLEQRIDDVTFKMNCPDIPDHIKNEILLEIEILEGLIREKESE